MPKKVEQAKIALLTSALEIEKTEFESKISIDRPEKMQAFLAEETRMLKAMTDKIKQSGANLVVCQKGMDDIVLGELSKAKIMAVRRAKESDLDYLSRATGARIIANIEELSGDDLGKAGLVEERKIETDKWVFIEGCKNPKAVSLVLKGGSERIVDEAERSMHDALMVVKDVVEKPAIVAGGGAPEALVSQWLREWATTIPGREHLAVQAFAEALDSIPLTLAHSAGMDLIDTMTEIRSMQAATTSNRWIGVDVKQATVGNMRTKNVIEPVAVKEQILKSATEVTAMLLRIDDIVSSSKTERTSKETGSIS